MLDDLIAYQTRRVLQYAQRIRPGLTGEDIRNVHDFPDVYGDPAFQFEDGQLSGLVSARIAVRSRLVGKLG